MDASTKLYQRILIVLLLVFLIPGVLAVGAGSPSPVQQATVVQASMSLSPPSLTVPVQALFTVDVIVDCGANADAAAAELTFDTAYMQVVSVTPDRTAFPNVLRNRYDNATGIVRYEAGAALECYALGNCPAGEVRLATVTFRAVAPTPQETYIGLRGQVTWSEEYTFDGEGSGSTVTILPPPVKLYLPLLLYNRR